MPFQSSTNQYQISKYIVDATGDTPYTTIQAAITDANTAGGNATVFVRNGTYTEDLTLYSTINVVGATGLGDSGDCVIVGTHVPPAAGSFIFRNVYLQSATDIFNSAVAGTSTLTLINVGIDVTNGFTFNLLNWTGSFVGFDIGEVGSTNDGWINNTGGATVFMHDTIMGAGAGNVTVISGDCELFNVHIQCPITFQGTGTSRVTGGSWFEDTITTAATATVAITNSVIGTGVNVAITHGSANELLLSDVSLISSNVAPVGGAGAGNLLIGTVTFLDESAIAGTLTVVRTPVLTTGVARTTLIEAIGSGAAAQNVIDIVPEIAIGGVDWNAINIDGAALDPTAANSSIRGINLDLTGVSLTNDPDIRGLYVEMPAVFAGDTEKCAVWAEGFGQEVELCSGDHNAAIEVRGESHFNYDGTGTGAGDLFNAVDISIDNEGSTGGELHALNISSAGTGTAAVTALGTTSGVAPIHQHIGAFGAVAQGWKENGGFTDTTVAFNAAGTDVTIFDADNDYIYIGANAVFDEIEVILETVSGRNIFAIFEYSIGGPAWTAFTPSDGTEGFTQNGIIQFNSADLAGWASVVVNAANHFYIRIQRTRNNIVTVPIEDTIQILAATTYEWDENAFLEIARATINPLTGDCFLSLQIGDTDEYVFGVDDDDGDSLKINQGGANPSAGTNVWRMSAAGDRIIPLQPAFLVRMDNVQTDFAINTEVTVIFDEETFDQSGDFNVGTYTFTSPVTGKYFLSAAVNIENIDTAATSYELVMKASNGGTGTEMDPRQFAADIAGQWTKTLSYLFDMDAADTVYVFVDQTAGAAQSDLVVGRSNWFSGALIC